MAITVSILGSTGSIGEQTLDIIRQHSDRYDVVALTAYSNVDTLFSQCQEFLPRYVVCVTKQPALELRQRLQEVGSKTQVLEGSEALEDVAKDGDSDVIVAAIVGAAGLPATFSAVKAGKKVLLANKEALVMSGALLMEAVHESQATLLPVDSEHNALFQCMPEGYLPGQGRPSSVEGLILTASGGPFLEYPVEKFSQITPAQAVAHPNWSMGAKISVDSATMMNKGLEVIEAHWLFSIESKDIEVVIHPQSIVHSLLKYIDGSVLAQCGMPDMRTPIAHCLAWPGRLSTPVERLDLLKVGRFDFVAPDFERFPCLKLAYNALQAGSVAMIVLNIANEIAVQAFLQGEIGYLQIPELVERYLSACVFSKPSSIGDVVEIEREVRALSFTAVL
jgi:1-deoxy-D-xylulose-5-phosphate reductoisomerase